MHHDHLDSNRAHERNIAGEALLDRGVAHRVTTKLHHHALPREALNVG